MFAYIAYWTWWFTWRLVITLACMVTLHNVIQYEGYHVEWSTLIIATIAAIVGIRVWMPSK